MRSGALLVLALAAACVPRDVRRGDGFALAEDWDAAEEAYRAAAVRRPGSAKITHKLALAERGQEQARREEGEAARQRAEAALMAGEYQTVLAELSVARRLAPESPAVRALMDTASAEVRQLAEERARAEGWAPAYPLAVLALRLGSGDAQATALVTRARSGLVSTLEERLDAGDFQGAGALADTVSAWEPDVGGELVTRVRARWSEALVGSAAAREQADREGEAWLLYARAAQLHPGEAALAGRERTGRPAVEAQRVSLSIAPPAEALASDLATLVRARLDGAGLRLVEAEGELRLSSLTATWSCAESVSTHPRSQRYVASTRWVDNPERRGAVARAYEVRTLVPEREAELAHTWGRVESTRYEAEQWRADWRVVEDSALRLEESAAQTEAWRDEAEAALREAQQEVSDAAGRGEDTGPYEALVEEWRSAVRSRSEAFDTAERAAEEARRRADDLRREAEDADEARVHAEGAHAEAERRLAEAVAAVDRADAQAASLPEQIEESVYADFAYETYAVERTCGVEASARLGPAGSTAPRAFEATRTVRDRHHPAFPAYGVDEDALSLGMSDAQMVEQALAEIATTLAAHVRAERDAAYARKAAKAEAPGERAALLLLAPGLGDPAWLAAEWSVTPEQLLAR